MNDFVFYDQGNV